MSRAQYSRIGADESLTFDYSSAFKYDSTQVYSLSQQYSSPFSYNHKKIDQPNIHLERGLKHKTIGVRFLHWAAITIYFALIALTLPISIWFVIKKARRDEQVILSRLGIVKCIRGPSILCVIPCIDKIKRYDTSLRAFNVPPQKLLTSNGLLVEVGAVVKYYITDAEKAFFGAQNLDHTLRVTAQSVAAKCIGKVDEKQLTDNNSIAEINTQIQLELQKVYTSWGITVNSFEMCGLKALVRIEQQDAISNVIEPLKQWFFGSQTGNYSASGTSSMPPVVVPGFSPPQPTPPMASATTAASLPKAANLENLRHNLTPTDLLTAVKSVCNRQLVEQIDAVYKFIVPGDLPGAYYLDLKNGAGDCGTGDPPSTSEPDTIITVSLANMQQMFTGSLRPFDAYMSGDLQISGDIGGAMKLDQLMKAIAAGPQAT